MAEVLTIKVSKVMLYFVPVSLFFKHWKKNYWDINQLPYYAQCYEVSSWGPKDIRALFVLAINE